MQRTSLLSGAAAAASRWRRRPGRAQGVRLRARNGARSSRSSPGDKVTVYTATTALQDPHRIEARPNLVAAARNAGLVVCTGAELERSAGCRC